jgi:hypothetical protein
MRREEGARHLELGDQVVAPPELEPQVGIGERVDRLAVGQDHAALTRGGGIGHPAAAPRLPDDFARVAGDLPDEGRPPGAVGRIAGTGPEGVEHDVEAGEARGGEVGDDARQPEDRDQLPRHRPEVEDGRRPGRGGRRRAGRRRGRPGGRAGGAVTAEGAHGHLRGKEALALLAGATIGVGHLGPSR